MIPTPQHYTFDARPLTDPVDPAAVRQHGAQVRARRRHSSAFGISKQTLGLIFAGVFVIAFLFLIVPVMTSVLTLAFGGGGLPVVIWLPFLVIPGIAVVILVARLNTSRANRERDYRLDRFAQANAMTWEDRIPNPPLPGMIFHLGSSRMASEVIRGTRPRFVEFGNYRYTTGSGDNKTTHTWGYVAVHLSSPLPHIVLDAHGNNGLFGSNLPLEFSKDQRLSLEGDFDKYFALHCPRGYERDALYLFTPDIMARFIDHAAALDVEIVDDWMFLYAKRDFSTLDANTWAWLFSAVSAFLDKFAQWERWRDDRLSSAPSAQPYVTATASDHPATSADDGVPFQAPAAPLQPPPGVAAQGRRLSTRTPWKTIITIAAFGILWFLMSSGILPALFFNR